MSDTTESNDPIAAQADSAEQPVAEAPVSPEPKREKWGQKIEFILTTLSFVVGFGL